MSDKKQSSVDYLVEQLFKTRNNSTEVKETNSESIIQQAKAMHKEEMKDLYLTHVTKVERLRKIFEKQFEELYNETFGGES